MNEDAITEEYILRIGFAIEKKDEEWPYTKIFRRGNLTLQYFHPWGQGNMDEGWELKKDGIRVEFNGYMNTLSGKLPNCFMLNKEDLINALKA